MRFLLIAVALTTGALLGSCSHHRSPQKAPQSPQAAPEGRAAAGSCHAQGVRPDPVCTPGATNPDVTPGTIAKTICVRGWTSTVRPPVSVTNAIKIERETAYGVPGPHPRQFAQEELDHFIPLELGGATADVRNLWPEPAPYYHAKDKVENALHRAVCAGKMSLAAAQQKITTNWQAVDAAP